MSRTWSAHFAHFAIASATATAIVKMNPPYHIEIVAVMPSIVRIVEGMLAWALQIVLRTKTSRCHIVEEMLPLAFRTVTATKF